MSTGVFVCLQLCLVILALLIKISIKNVEIEELEKERLRSLDRYSDEELLLLEKRVQLERYTRYVKNLKAEDIFPLGADQDKKNGGQK